MMADSSAAAMPRGMSTPRLRNSMVTMVAVEPTGRLMKGMGLAVITSAMRWWSMISTTSASSMPWAAWRVSLWSTRMTLRFGRVATSVRVTMPMQKPSSSSTTASRRALAIRSSTASASRPSLSSTSTSVSVMSATFWPSDSMRSAATAMLFAPPSSSMSVDEM